MKEAIVDILEGILGIFIVAATIIGFVVFGNINPFGGFSFGLALLGGIASLLFAILSSGVVYVFLIIRDQQDEQIRLLRQIERSLSAGTESTQHTQQASEASLWRTSAQSTPRPTSSSTLRRCRRCNTMLNDGASKCHSCGAPVTA